MANTTDKSILTAAGKALLAQLNAEEKPLVIDKMIFANVPNRPEFPQPDDVVPTDHVVHQEGVEQRGRLSADSVIYSTTLPSDVGPFEFNWTGAYCSEYGVLVTIDHHALTPKSADEPGVAGNTLVRSVVLEYKDIAEITNITVDASSWQYNATPRMKKMDDDVAQAIIDQNGKDWFIEDGFLVTPQPSAFNIKAGAGYVSGNRVMLEFDRNVQVPNKPSFIYVDAHREGTPTGEQVTLFDFVITAEERDDYTDANGVKHFVCKIAQVLADKSVSDLRPEGESADKGWVRINTPINVPSVEALRNLSNLHDGQSINLQGYSYIGDGCGGRLYVDLNDTETLDDGGTVFVTNDGTRVKRDIEDKLISLSFWGPLEPDIPHDEIVISALSSAAKMGGKLSGASNTVLNQTKTWPIPKDCSVHVDLSDAEIKKTGSFASISNSVSVKDTVQLTAHDVQRGRNYFICDSAEDAAKFSPGDLIQFKSNNLWYFYNRGHIFKGGTYVVENVFGSTVGIRGQFFDLFNVEGPGSEIVFIDIIGHVNIKLENFYINNGDGEEFGGWALTGIVDGEINNVRTKGSQKVGGTLSRSYNTHVKGGGDLNCNDAGIGYGVQINESTACTVDKRYSYNCRRAVDISGSYPSYNCGARWCYFDGAGTDSDGNPIIDSSGQSAFGGHSASCGTIFENNQFTNVKHGFNCRGFNELVDSNIGYGRVHSYVASTSGSNLTVTNNKYFSYEGSFLTPGASDGQHRLRHWVWLYNDDGRGKTVIKNNIADKLEQSVLLVNDKSSLGVLEDLELTDNSISLFGTPDYVGGDNKVYLIENNDDQSPFTMKSSKMKNNRIGRVEADSSYLQLSGGIAVSFVEGESCICDHIPINVEFETTGGHSASISGKLYATIDEGSTHVYGQLILVVTSTTKITLKGLPSKRYGQLLKFMCMSYDQGQLYLSYPGTSADREKLYLSTDPVVLNSDIPAGEYRVSVDLTHENNLHTYY